MTSLELDGAAAAWDVDGAQATGNEGGQTDGTVIAQATEQPEAMASDEPVPVDVGTGGATVPASAGLPAEGDREFVADANNVVHLPANISVENIRVEGGDLVLEQADGTLIVIKDAAANVPTFLIGEVELSRVALLAALQASGVDVAFGADGSMAASPGGSLPNSSGGNFTQPPGNIGDGFDITDLLPPTALAFPQYDGRELFLAVNADPLFEAFTVTLSEEGLDGANPDDVGSDDTTNTKIITGNFGASDPNNDPLTYSLAAPGPGVNAGITSGGVAVTWHLVSETVLEGRAGGDVVLRVEITNPDNGDFQIELIGPFDHPDKGAEDNVPIVIPVVVEDVFGGSKTANMTVVIEDDSPLLNGVRLGSTAVLDETDAGSPAGFDPAGITVTSAQPILAFTSSFGADGAAAGGGIVFALSITGGMDSGLKTAIGDHPIALVQTDSTTITGTYSDGTQTAFTIKINGDGTLTVTQYEPLEHLTDGSSAAAHDDQLNLSGKIRAEVTVTDFDGDEVGGFAQIGGSIIFKDDGPSVVSQAIARTADEDDIDSSFSKGTSPSDGAGDDSDTVDSPFGKSASVSGSLAALVDFGADGPAEGGGFGFTPTAVNQMAGLGLLSQGEALSYTVDGDTLIAYVDDGDGSYTAADRTVFDLKVDASTGDYMFRQHDQLDHAAPPAGSAEENTALKTATGSIPAIDFGAVIRATDSDGDYVDLSGQFTITIRDDIPELELQATEATVIHDETAGIDPDASDTNDVASIFAAIEAANGLNEIGYAHSGSPLIQFTTASGTDEPKTVSVTLEIVGSNGTDSGLVTTAGRQISLYLENGLIVGRVDNANGNPNPSGAIAFAAAIDADGSVSVAQYVAIKHPTAGDGSADSHDEPVSLSGKIQAAVTVTDSDLDTVKQTVQIGDKIVFEDDGPKATGSAAPLLVDEDDLLTLLSQGTSPHDGTADGSSTDILGGAASASGSLASVVNFGTDGAKAGGGFTFTPTAVADLTAIGLESKGEALSYVIVGNTIIGFVDSNNSGGYNLVGDRTVLSFQLNPNTGAFTFKLFDQLDHVAPTPGTADQNTQLVTAGGSVPSIDFGSVIRATDGDGDFVDLDGKVDITVTDDIPNIFLKATGKSVIHDETAGNDADAHDTSLAAVADQFGALEAAESISAIGYARNPLPLFLYGPAVPNQGADDLLSFDIALGIAGDIDSGLKTTEGQQISLYVEDGLIVGRVDNADGSPNSGGDVAFAIAVDVLGGVSIAQYLSLEHPVPGSSHDEAINLAGKINITVSATDADGDTVSNTIEIGDKIVFQDDGPKLTGATESKTVNEDDIATSTSLGSSPHWSFLPDAENDGDDSHTAFLAGPAITSGNLGALVSSGADDPVTFGFSANALQHLEGLQLYSKQTATGDGENGKLLTYTLSPDGNTITAWEPNPDGNKVFELELDPATGAYEFRLYDELIHEAPPAGTSHENALLRSGPNGATIDGISFGAIIEARDGDGDTVLLGDAFKIIVLDDVPTANISLTGATVIHDETPGDDGNHDTTSPEVAALFAGVDNPGVDPDMPAGYARNGLPIVVSLSTIGADAPAYPAVYTLSVGADGLDSGLQTTEGQPILLYNENGIIVGRVAGPEGSAAFAVHIDGQGRVSVAQYLSIKHDDVNDHDESNDNGTNAADHGAVNETPNPVQQSLAGKITATLTVKDSDGDAASDSVDIGDRIRFEDDGPRVEVTDQVSGEEANQLKLQLDETKGADRYNGAEPQDGNGAADDGAGALPIVPKTAPAAADAIGSRTTAVVGGLGALFNVTASYGADGPFAGQQGAARVDTLGLDVTGNGKTNIVVTALEGTPLESLSDANRTVYLVEVSPGVVEGRIPGGNGALGGGDDYVAFRISLTNPSDPAASQITVEQFLAVDHGGSEDPSVFDEQISMLLTGSSALKLVLETRITDGDHDYDSDSDSVTLIDKNGSIVAIDDDGPVMLTTTSGARDWTLDEDILVDGAPEVNGNDARDDLYNAPAPHYQDTNDYAGNAINNKPLGIGWGSDGAGTIAFVATAGTPNLVINGSASGGLASGGVALHYVITPEGDGQLLTAYKGVGGEPVFTLKLDPNAGPTGEFSFQLLEELDHAAGNGQQALDITFSFTATDGDGDAVTSQVVIRVTDDVPYAPEAPQNLIDNGAFSSLTGNQVSDWWGTLAEGAAGWVLAQGGGNPVGQTQIELVPNNYQGRGTRFR